MTELDYYKIIHHIDCDLHDGNYIINDAEEDEFVDKLLRFEEKYLDKECGGYHISDDKDDDNGLTYYEWDMLKDFIKKGLVDYDEDEDVYSNLFIVCGLESEKFLVELSSGRFDLRRRTDEEYEAYLNETYKPYNHNDNN